MQEKPKKNVYKKSLMVELVKRDHNFLHSMTNKKDNRHQIWVFEDTEQLKRDIAELSGHEYVEKL